MRAVVTGGAGFIGSNLVDALLARGDEVIVVDNFASGKRENLNPDGDAARARHPRAVRGRRRRGLPPRRAGRRADVDEAARVRRGGQRRRHGQRAAGGAGGAQVVFASSGGAGYGECPEPATEEAPFLPLSPYGIAKKCGEEYLARLEPHPRHVARRAPLRERLRAAPGLRASRAASSRSSSSAWRAARRRRSSATARRAATSSTSTTSSPRCSRPSARRGGRTTSAPATRRPSAQLHAACRAVAGVDATPQLEDARLGDVLRSVLDLVADRARARLARAGLARRRPARAPGRGCRKQGAP